MVAMTVVTFPGSAAGRLLHSQGVVGVGARALPAAAGFGAYVQRPSGVPCRL